MVLPPFSKGGTNIAKVEIFVKKGKLQIQGQNQLKIANSPGENAKFPQKSAGILKIHFF